MQTTERIWFDGALVPWDAAQVHVLTHTLHYGLGVFEGIRCYACDDGRSAVFRLREHIDRLYGSAHVLDLPIPYPRERLVDACLETVRANRLRECYIRPIAFMGDGEMGVAARTPTRVAIAAWPWGAYLGDEGLAQGIRVKTSSFQRFHPNTLLTKAKAVGHYVNSILAAREARAAGYDEALLLDVDGYVSEASGENVFIVADGVVKTTPLPTVLGGITRQAILRLLADLGTMVREERFTRDEVYLADEAFFTGTAAEVTPIRELDDRRIGAGRPGPVTRGLQELFFAIVKGRDARYASWLTYV
ncbi:MAG TPA: branched-chain amino acid transaminase [Candidatus Binatia bacterium]|jgi:branched-chain amino acid aminotransferase|nr:branched-chain amino acid transaminase [Candidatus Binatia bacterium]